MWAGPRTHPILNAQVRKNRLRQPPASGGPHQLLFEPIETQTCHREVLTVLGWQLVFCAFFLIWGGFCFLCVVSYEIHGQRAHLERQKSIQEEKDRRESLLTITTATPIAWDAEPEFPPVDQS